MQEPSQPQEGCRLLGPDIQAIQPQLPQEIQASLKQCARRFGAPQHPVEHSLPGQDPGQKALATVWLGRERCGRRLASHRSLAEARTAFVEVAQPVQHPAQPFDAATLDTPVPRCLDVCHIRRHLGAHLPLAWAAQSCAPPLGRGCVVDGVSVTNDIAAIGARKLFGGIFAQQFVHLPASDRPFLQQ